MLYAKSAHVQGIRADRALGGHQLLLENAGQLILQLACPRHVDARLELDLKGLAPGQLVVVGIEYGAHIDFGAGQLFR